MIYLRKLFPANLENKQFFSALVFAGLSFIGFLDAGYLSVSHYTGQSVSCSLIKGCDKVLNSPYAQIYGIPVALLGVVYYLSIFFLALGYVSMKDKKLLRVTAFLTCVGFVASLVFVGIQYFIIHSFCEYCLISAATSTVLFAVGIRTIYSS